MKSNSYVLPVTVGSCTMLCIFIGGPRELVRKAKKTYAPLRDKMQKRQYRVELRFDKKLTSQKFFLKEKNNFLFYSDPSHIVGNIDVKKRVGKFTLRPKATSITSILSLMYFLDVCTMGGFMIHASSIAYRRRGYVFFGEQGAGKSTISKLSGQRILSDDVTIIVRQNNIYYVVSNPFDAKIPIHRPKMYRLQKCILLSHDVSQVDVVRRIPSRNAASVLLRYLRPNAKFLEKSPTYLFSFAVGVQSFASRFSEFYSLGFSKTTRFLDNI